MLRRRLAVPAALLALAAGFALAQPGGGRPGGNLPSVPGVPSAPSVPGQPGIPGQPGGGQPGFDPQQFIDRLMQSDANGDGKLSRAEVPPQFAERNFDRLDTNTDGFLDRAELQAGTGNMRGGPGGGGGRAPLGRAMHSIEDAMHALHDSALNASTQEADLVQVQSLQEGFLAAKFHVPTQRLEAEVLAHFDGSEAAARAEFREHLIEALNVSLELEEAIMAGDADAARASLDALIELEESGHAVFAAH